MNPSLKKCSKCQNLMLVGAWHRPECSAKEELPTLLLLGDTYIPVGINCKDYAPIEEPE